eukprot:CAMPEP_0194354664 /NCGR_PEP_ID=MMETSP0174-20130528/2750_1 /TAXON_ID=216777 /ORGANISM="Proboscia alata, Strain PI-D3" /LENGTH=472 /DNA_ID=CAMNT_0039123669 /DNA_START=135 /DNA_END=1550 /DNA_ORIENTATION=-
MISSVVCARLGRTVSSNRRTLAASSVLSHPFRTFSSEAVATAPVTSTRHVHPPRPIGEIPSYLSSLNIPPEKFTPGKAFQLINDRVTNGQLASRNEFLAICNTSRPESLKDATVIYKALIKLRRCNGHVFVGYEGTAAVEGMIRSCTPVERPKMSMEKMKQKKMDRAGFLVEAVLDKDTTLYTCITDEDYEKVVKFVYEATTYYVPPAADQPAEADEAEEVEEAAEEPTEELGYHAKLKLTKSQRTPLQILTDQTKETFRMMVQRASPKPTNRMTKRAARKYNRHAMQTTPPNSEAVRLVVQLCLVAGDLDGAEELVEFYHHILRKNVDAGVLDTIAEAQRLKLAEEEAVIAAAAGVQRLLEEEAAEAQRLLEEQEAEALRLKEEEEAEAQRLLEEEKAAAQLLLEEEAAEAQRFLEGEKAAAQLLLKEEAAEAQRLLEEEAEALNAKEEAVAEVQTNKTVDTDSNTSDSDS